MTMSRRALTAALVLSGAAVAARPIPSAEEPPAGVTGGFGEPTCAQCHIGNDINAFGGSVSVEGLPAAYEFGEAYVLTADLRAEETDVAGFQITARFAADGASAGRLHPVDDRTATKDSLGVEYLYQSRVGSRPADRSGARWTFEWRAPERGGTVVLSVAANSGNADESPLGDLVYTHESRVSAAAAGAEGPEPTSSHRSSGSR